MTFSMSLLGVGLVLVLAQVLAALPWLLVAVFNWDSVMTTARQIVRAPLAASRGTRYVVLVFFGLPLAALAVSYILHFIRAREALEGWGRLYGAVLHLQLIVDFFILAFAGLLSLWPKGGAVALAAFREGLRQPMFWLLLCAFFAAMLVSPFIPYFTFGEDLVMVKELGYDFTMLAAVIFGVLAASMSISEEIEGRTAITLMSKPISRRQFLLGKYVGILLAAAVMIGLLGWTFNWIVIYKRWYEEPTAAVATPPLVTSTVNAVLAPGEAADFVLGTGRWIADCVENLPGLLLGFCQVMVLLAVAVTLATRLPMVVNLVICVLVYFLGHLSPVLSEIANRRLDASPGAAGNQMLSFMATLVNYTLPGMEFFSVGPALVTDSPPPLGQFYGYVGEVMLYCGLYTSILLLIGLVLFEDRDLA